MRGKPILGSLVLVTLFGPIATSPGPLSAQRAVPPNRGGMTTSMGAPPDWRWFAGFSGGLHRKDDSQAVLYGHGSLYRHLFNPMTGAPGLLGDAYMGYRGTFATPGAGMDGGLRLSFHSPVLRLAVGVDYNLRDGEGDVLVSFIHPIKRGGIAAAGGSLRIDYLPGRAHSFAVGLHLPVGQDFVGVTRPRLDYVEFSDPTPPEIPFAPEPALLDAVQEATGHAHWIRRFTVPFTDHWDGNADEALDRFVEDMAGTRAHLMASSDPGGRPSDPVSEVRAFHDAIDRLFSVATAPDGIDPGHPTPLGLLAAREARDAVFRQVLVPYNQALGQKKRSDSTRGLGASASAEFYEWLNSRGAVVRSRVEAATWAFQQYLEIVEGIRAQSVADWEDSRFVWLPFQLALRPEQHDSQAELNELVEIVTDQRFTRGNRHWYVENEQFQAELTRMITEARDYHVLWVHDFRGYDSEGDPDEMSYRQVVEAYLPALIRSVRAYDERGKIPQYLVFLDQMFYQANRGWLWLDLLQDPLRHELELPDEFQVWQDSVVALQNTLREAVADSRLLQSQALHFGDAWIRNVVKVHVNITNPPDPSFWTREIFPRFIGLPDVIMRDHRKISFFDVSEDDPYRGRAIYTGLGVGEHYVGNAWEDRSMMVQGPVALSLKDAARQLLLNQGLTDVQIPWELRERELAPDYGRMVTDSIEALGDWGWDMQLHNQTGFRFKAVSVFKATLYSLMPPGSVIKAPDSIWGAQFWAPLLLGPPLRGGRTLVIAPAIATAPSPGFPQMSRAQEVLARLVIAEEMLGEAIERQGGLLKVGLYTSRIPVGDLPSKLDAFLATIREEAWVRDLYGFHPKVIEDFERGIAALRITNGNGANGDIDPDQLPQLHLKANLFASREAWDGLLARDDIAQSLLVYFEEAAKQAAAVQEGEYRPFILDDLLPRTHEILVDYAESLPPDERERIAMFLSVGSHNQNNRSFALDGEVSFTIGGWSSLFGVPDFLILVGLCYWIEVVEHLERLFPGYEGMQRRISHWLRIAV